MIVPENIIIIYCFGFLLAATAHEHTEKYHMGKIIISQALFTILIHPSSERVPNLCKQSDLDFIADIKS